MTNDNRNDMISIIMSYLSYHIISQYRGELKKSIQPFRETLNNIHFNQCDIFVHAYTIKEN